VDFLTNEARGKRIISGRISLGRKGEELALDFLKKQGYRIIERNYRCRAGEIDIVAKEGSSLAFVEVKTRQSTHFGLPEEAVSYEKRHHLTRAASVYLIHHHIKEAKCRFDVVSVLMNESGVKEIRIIKNAFEAVY
jgi:putative endonuclease